MLKSDTPWEGQFFHHRLHVVWFTPPSLQRCDQRGTGKTLSGEDGYFQVTGAPTIKGLADKHLTSVSAPTIKGQNHTQ